VLIIGGVDFSNIVITLQEATETTEAVTISIGLFINATIEFLIIAFAVFMLIRAINNMAERLEKKQEEEPEAPAEPTTEEKLLDAIQDLTKAINADK